MPEIFYFMMNIKYLISQTCVVLIITQCLLTHSKDFIIKPLVNFENTLEENNTTKVLTLKLYKNLRSSTFYYLEILPLPSNEA